MDLSGIQATNDDATECKAYAVSRKYWNDPFILYFKPTVRPKAPEINTGYFIRVDSIETCVIKFIQSHDKCQIVNLGCGYDTLFWRLSELRKCKPLTFVDVDYVDVTTRKCACIKRSNELLCVINDEDEDILYSATDLHSAIYHLVSADLSNTVQLYDKLVSCHIDFSLPTLFIAECVLVYMESVRSRELLRWIVEHFSTAVFVNYEQVNMNDRFGTVMANNLKQRNCMLSGIDHCQSIHTQKQRFVDTGWEQTNVRTMNEIWQSVAIPIKQRIEKIEMLDEKELLEQLLQHYCLAMASFDRREASDKLDLQAVLP